MTILIVDDQDIFAESISLLLRLKLKGSTICTALRAQEALMMIPKIHPDVVLLDVNMPGEMNGLDLAKILRSNYPAIKIVILTNVDGVIMTLHLIQTGVHGFLFKDTGGKELKKCIEMVLEGEKYFCEKIKKTLLAHRELLGNLPDIAFSKREIDLIVLMADGKLTKEISHILGISENTINSYRKELLKKTQTKNANELIAYAFKNVLMNWAKEN